jgi:hypothetical protein
MVEQALAQYNQMDINELISNLDLLLVDLKDIQDRVTVIRIQLMHVNASTVPNGGVEDINEDQRFILEAIKNRKKFLNK